MNSVTMRQHLTLWAAAILLALPLSSFGQENPTVIDKSRLPAQADSIQKFVPAGWKIEEQISGDLNGDALPDHVLKLVEDKPAKDEEGVATERSRAMVVVQQQSAARLSRMAVAGKLLQCTRCGGAFYGVVETPANVTIEKGVIVVQQDHGSRNLTNTTYRFRYDRESGRMVLIGFDYADADRATAQVVSESTNYLTGVRKISRDKGERTAESSKQVSKRKVFLDDVDAEEFEMAAAKRLGLG
jgi:hypothetical protein